MDFGTVFAIEDAVADDDHGSLGALQRLAEVVGAGGGVEQD